MSLHEHIHHEHVPRRIDLASIHREVNGENTHLAVWLTTHVGSMWCAYSFALLALVGLLAILGVIPPVVALLVAWVSQTFIQLVLLPVIMVGQNVLSLHAEQMAEEQFLTTQKTYHEIEQVLLHLDAQDSELLKQTTLLIQLARQS